MLVCLRAPRQALRDGRDEDLHQLAVAIDHIGRSIGDCGSAESLPFGSVSSKGKAQVRSLPLPRAVLNHQLSARQRRVNACSVNTKL